MCTLLVSKDSCSRADVGSRADVNLNLPPTDFSQTNGVPSTRGSFFCIVCFFVLVNLVRLLSCVYLHMSL